MNGPFYVNTDVRRRAAWGPPCKPNLGPVIIDGKQYQCDRSVIGAFNELERVRSKYNFHQNGADTGFYNCRRMRHDPSMPFSPHAWARALDWDWLQNPAGNKLITNMPSGMIRELQSLMTVSGAYVFMWGGDWDRNPRTGHNYYDAMHWEVIAHPLDLATGVRPSTGPAPLPIIPVGDDDMAIKKPARGGMVKAIQQALNVWEPTLALLDDGIYGDTTEAAVKRYQQSAAIPVTGSIDGLTAAGLLTVKLRKTVAQGGLLP